MLSAMANLIRWCLFTVVVTSVATAVVVRSTGYTGVSTEAGKYFVTYKSARYEVSRDDFERTRRRDRINGVAVMCGMFSCFAFVGFESVRFRGRPHVAKRHAA